MRTFNANWVDAFGADKVKPVALVEIFESASTSHKFISGDEPLFGAHMSLASIGRIGKQLDIKKRTVTSSGFECVFMDDGTLRSIMSSIRLKGKRVSIKIGEASLAENDFEIVGGNSLVIDNMSAGEGEITLTIIDVAMILFDEDLGPFFSPDHPLNIAAENIATQIGDSSFVDAASFDEKQYVTTSHFVLGRPQFSGFVFNHLHQDVKRPSEKMREQLGWIARLMGGAIYAGDDGKLKYRDYSRTAVSNRHFTVDDYEGFEQPNTTDEVINRLRVIGYGVYGNDKMPYIEANNTTSQTDHGYPTTSIAVPKIYEDAIINPMLGNMTKLTKGVDATETQLSINAPLYHGFCGTLMRDGADNELAPDVNDFPPTQQSEHKLDGTTRVGWFLITDHVDKSRGGKREIVKATAFTYDPGFSVIVGRPDDPSGGGNKNYWALGEYTIVRNQPGTPSGAVDWSARLGQTEVYVYDITIAKYICDTVLDRYANGVPEVRFKVPLDNLDLEIGDVFTIDAPTFIHFGIDGATIATHFEIKKLTPTILADNSSGVMIEGAFLYETSPGAAPVPAYETFDPGAANPVTIDENFLLGKIGSVIHDIYGNDNDKMRVS